MSDIIDMLEDVNSTLKEEIVTLNKLTYIVDQQNEQGEGQKVSYKEAYESISEQHKNAMARVSELKAENERLKADINSDNIDEQLKAAGMLTVSELIAGQPIDGFFVNADMDSLEKFKYWLDSRANEIKRMKAKRVLAKKEDDELFEWVCAHDAAINEVRLNFNAATKP